MKCPFCQREMRLQGIGVWECNNENSESFVRVIKGKKEAPRMFDAHKGDSE